MADGKKECFGQYDEENWDCDPESCEDSKACQKATNGEKKAPAKKSSKKKTDAKAKAKAAKAKAKAVVEKKKPSKEQKTKAVKKVAENKDAKKKPSKKNAVVKAVKAEVVEPEEKIVTKEVEAKANKLAEEIKALKGKAAKSFSDLILKGGPKIKKVQEMLPPQAFDEWCRDKVGYDRTMALRIVQGYETFKDKPELIANLGPTKLLAVLPHPEPVKFLEKHKDEAEEMPYREFREVIKEDKEKITGEPTKTKKKDKLEGIIKAVRTVSSTMEKTFMDLNSYAGRKNVKLDAAQQEALTLHLENMEEWTEKIREILEKAEG